MPYPQNQVTVRSSETGDVFRTSRDFAERQDTLTILDDLKAWDEIGGFLTDADPGEDGWNVVTVNTQFQSADTPVDPIAAPVADDK